MEASRVAARGVDRIRHSRGTGSASMSVRSTRAASSWGFDPRTDEDAGYLRAGVGQLSRGTDLPSVPPATEPRNKRQFGGGPV
jgi:hypothetical protein